MTSEKKNFKLFRFEYLYVDERVVDWVWLTGEDEANEYLTGDAGISGVIHRRATEDEEAEKFRQEGREEVLDWLVSKELLNYSIPEDMYFKWDWYTSKMTQLFWTKSKEK